MTVPEIKTKKERSACIQGIRKTVTKTMWDEECDEVRQEVEEVRIAEDESTDANRGEKEIGDISDEMEGFTPRQYQE